jgi:Trypsin-like peptidase domain
MFEPISIAEQMMYATVRIVGQTAGGVKTGTEFLYSAPAKGGILLMLITNKHVIEGTTSLEFVVHTKSDPNAKKPDGQETVTSNIADWTNHPDARIDLCAVPVGGAFNSMKPPVFYVGVGADLIQSQAELERLNAVEDVLMVGYPNGLWDAKNNFPLIRRGITASHPAVDYDVNGVATTVIDMACFPGSSGSPVLIYNNGSFVDKQGSVHLGSSRTILLGVLFSGPTIQADGSIVIKNIPTVATPVAQLNLMMNLGYIIKAAEVKALAEAVLKRHNVDPP